MSPDKQDGNEPKQEGWADSDSLEEVDVQVTDENGVGSKPKNEQISGSMPTFANVMAG